MNTFVYHLLHVFADELKSKTKVNLTGKTSANFFYAPNEVSLCFSYKVTKLLDITKYTSR